MDIIDLIKEDHEKIADLFQKLISAPEDNIEERNSFYKDLRSALESHTNAEERTLYQRLEDTDGLRDEIPESYEDHKAVSTLLQSISEIEVNDPQWMSRILVLKENVENHVRREEDYLLPLAQAIISDSERDEMGDDMESLEDEIVSAGPGLVTQTPAQTMLGTNV